MKKYRFVFFCLFALLLLYPAFADNEPTGVRTPYCEMIPQFSNFLLNVYDGYNAVFHGGFMEGVYIYSPTPGGIGDTYYNDYYWGGTNDGEYMENCWDQMFMATLIVSENGQAYSGGVQNNALNHLQFSMYTLNQIQDFMLFGSMTNPRMTDAFGAPYFFYDRHFSPHYPIGGTIETMARVTDGSGLVIRSITSQYPSDKYENIDDWTYVPLDVLNPINALGDVVMRNYSVTNTSSAKKTIYLTQRLDPAINTYWAYQSETDIGNGYKRKDYFSANNGEFNDLAGFQHPLGGLYKGNFAYAYDNEQGYPSGIGLKLLTDTCPTASFKIVKYVPAFTDIDGDGFEDNRLVKYSVKSAADTMYINSINLLPLNPMEYISSALYYNDFVSPGTFSTNVTEPGNYSIAITAGPFEIEAGQTVNVTFAYAGGYGADMTAFLSDLDAKLYKAYEYSYLGRDGYTEDVFGFAELDMAPPAAPQIGSVYEKYDVLSDTVTLNIKWDTVNMTGWETEGYTLGCGYNVYVSTNAELRYNRLTEKEIWQLEGALKNAPTAYNIYTSTAYVCNSTQFQTSISQDYTFAISAHDEKWYSSDTVTYPHCYQNYFNESDYSLYEINLVPAEMDLSVDFDNENNENDFELSWSAAGSAEKDLYYYEVFRKEAAGSYDLVHTVYLQGGAYKFLEANPTINIKLYFDHYYYDTHGDLQHKATVNTILASDISFNPNDVLTEALIDKDAVEEVNPYVIKNLSVQKIENGETIFTVSDSDTTPVDYVIIAEGWDTYVWISGGKTYWEIYDDYGNKAYLNSDFDTVQTLPAGAVKTTGFLAECSPESLRDYHKTEFAGSTDYTYYVKKHDFLTAYDELPESPEVTVRSTPDYPKNLAVTNLNNSVRLNWDAAAGDIYRYYIYRCSTSAILSSAEPLAEDYIERIGAVYHDTYPDTLEFIDSFTSDYKTFYYFVTAYNRTENTESKPSNIVYVTKYFDYASDLEKAHPVPNPFIYGSPNAAKEGNSLVFIQLTPKAEIVLYNIRGNVIRKLSHTASSTSAYGTGGERWDLLNEDGNPVATGLYYYVITNPDDPDDVKKGQLAVIR